MKTMCYLNLPLSAFLLSGCTTAAAMTKAQNAVRVETLPELNLSEEEQLETYDDATAVHIQFNGTETAIEGSGAQLKDGILTISAPGTYVLSGNGTAAVVIDTEQKGNVHLVLNGVKLNSESGPAVYVANAEKTILTVLTGTKNTLEADGENADGKKGCIYAKDDLVINGGGSLELTASSGDGIHGNDEVKLVNAMLTVHAESDGIDANDYLGIKDCILNLTAGKDGIKAGDTDEDTGEVTVSAIEIDGGVLTITAEDDGIQATGDISAASAELQIEAGGGYQNAAAHAADPANGMFGMREGFRKEGALQEGFGNRKDFGFQPSQGFDHTQRPENQDTMNGEDSGSAIPPEMNFHPEGSEPATAEQQRETAAPESSAQTESVPSENQKETASETEEELSKGIKAGGSIVLADVTVEINSADDALHADADLSIQDGAITAKAGDDALHADGAMTLNPGKLEITASYEGLEAKNLIIEGGELLITASDDGINTVDPDSQAGEFAADASLFTMNGGTVIVDADGDGVDCNGDGVINGGSLTVYGPEKSANGALDYNGSFTVNGGTLLAGGDARMALVPDAGNNAYVINVGITDSSGAIEVKTSDGTVIATYASDKSCTDLVIASDQLVKGKSYTIVQNGNEFGEVTISDPITYLNKTVGSGFENGQGMFGGKRETDLPSGATPGTDGSKPGQLPEGRGQFPEDAEQKQM